MLRRAFTLIEILVVIAIIALLSSVVIASLNLARERGRIGAGRSFASQVDHAAGDSAVGIWDLDECAGTVANDKSGFGVTGTGTNGPTWSTDSPNTAGCSMVFDGSNDYVSLGTGRVGQNLHGASAVTVSAWVKYSSLQAHQWGNEIVSIRITSLSGAWLNIRGDGTEVGKVLFGGRSVSTEAFQQTTSSAILRPDTWHHVVGILNYTTDTITIYIDGAQSVKTSVSFVSPTYVQGTASALDTINNGGASMGDLASYPLAGSIDGVRVYAKGLTAFEVQQLYAEGAARRVASTIP